MMIHVDDQVKATLSKVMKKQSNVDLLMEGQVSQDTTVVLLYPLDAHVTRQHLI